MVQPKRPKNPLTLRERLDVGRIVGHDDIIGALGLTNQHAHMWVNQVHENQDSEPDELSTAKQFDSSYMHLASMLLALEAMQGDDNTLGSVRYFAFKPRFSDMIISISDANKAKFQFDVTFPEDLVTNPYVLYEATFNLAMNAQFRGSQIHVVGQEVSGLEDIVYYPRTTRGYKTDFTLHPEYSAKTDDEVWWRLSVHDQGDGFSDEPVQFLKDGATTKTSGGFGLYFVTLAANYLGAPLSIHSEKGNTWVGLNLPL